jgi:hypothetical protein
LARAFENKEDLTEQLIQRHDAAQQFSDPIPLLLRPHICAGSTSAAGYDPTKYYR